MNKLLFLFIIFFPAILMGAEQVFVVDKPLKQIVTDLNEGMIQQQEQTAKLMREGLRMLWKFDRYIFEPSLIIQLQGWPSKHYYMSNIQLLQPYGKLGYFQRKVEIWGQPNRTIVRINIELDTTRQFRVGLFQSIKNRIVCRVENYLVCKESNRLYCLATKPIKPPKRIELKESALLFINNLWEYLREKQTISKTTTGPTT